MNPTGRPELELFASEVLSRLGFRLDEHNIDPIEQVVRERLERTGCGTVETYVARLQNEPVFGREELREIALRVTVPETYFFRHPEQFQALSATVLPACLEARKASRQLRVLSAGCASGEEAYSIAAAILDCPGFEGWILRIWAIDVNGQLLDKARQGRYSEWALRALGEAERRRLVRREADGYLLNERLRGMVQFEERNLLDESFWQTAAFDIVFCRNVLIYFTPQAVRLFASLLARSVAPGGFLFLGPTETLRGISHEFHLRHTQGAFYYQHRWPGEEPERATGAEPVRKPRAAVPGLAGTSVDNDWADAIAGATQRIAALANRSRAAQAASRGEPAAAFPARQDLEEVHALLRQERFQDALRVLEARPRSGAADPDSLMIQAVLLANSGELDRARQICEQLLFHDELRPGAHYLMAVCHEKCGEHLVAAEHDQTAIYLDPKFAMPRLHLGLLARRLGDVRTARKELAEALALLGREDAGRMLLFGGGFSREALLQFCRAQLELCGGNP